MLNLSHLPNQSEVPAGYSGQTCCVIQCNPIVTRDDDLSQPSLIHLLPFCSLIHCISINTMSYFYFCLAPSIFWQCLVFMEQMDKDMNTFFMAWFIVFYNSFLLLYIPSLDVQLIKADSKSSSQLYPQTLGHFRHKLGL